MASFQAKIVWKRLRKGENKNYRFVLLLPGAELKIQKKIKKNKKTKKHYYGIVSSQNSLKKAMKEI